MNKAKLKKILLMSITGGVEGLACADLGARNDNKDKSMRKRNLLQKRASGHIYSFVGDYIV